MIVKKGDLVLVDKENNIDSKECVMPPIGLVINLKANSLFKHKRIWSVHLLPKDVTEIQGDPQLPTIDINEQYLTPIRGLDTADLVVVRYPDNTPVITLDDLYIIDKAAQYISSAPEQKSSCGLSKKSLLSELSRLDIKLRFFYQMMNQDDNTPVDESMEG